MTETDGRGRRIEVRIEEDDAPSEETRSDAQRDDAEPLSDASEGAAGEAQAGGAEAGEAQAGEAEAGEAQADQDPVIVSFGDADADPDGTDPETEQPARRVLTPADESLRAALAELKRENMRLDGDRGKLQTELYQAKVALGRAEEKLEEAKEKLTLSQAEFQNYRRRSERERQEAERHANAELLSSLLPVLDNFDRAMTTPPGPETIQDFHKGIELIHKQLLDALAGFELRAVEAVGQAFDPNFHEAVNRSETHEVPPDHVVSELRRGYMYRDRLLRPAMVEVAVAPAAAAAAPAGGSTAGASDGVSGEDSRPPTEGATTPGEADAASPGDPPARAGDGDGSERE